jgi:ELWxxDGT repeat protein
VSDGTAQGTVVLEENLDLACYLDEHPCIGEMDGGFVFSGTVADPYDETELWFSDGTPDGTRLVKNLREGSSSFPRSFTRVGDLAFFIAAGTEGGTEVWRTDGTAEATFMVRDIYTGTSWHRPTDLTAHGSLLYFVAYENQAQGYQLWVSDGTEDGTTKVVEEPLDPRQLISHSDGLYFLTRPDRHEQILWRTDGSPEGTVAVISFGDGTAKLEVIGDNLYLVAKLEDQTLAVWRIRTFDDAELVIRDHGRWGWGYEFRRLVSHGRSLIFAASAHTYGHELWRIFEAPEPRSTGRRVGGP